MDVQIFVSSEKPASARRKQKEKEQEREGEMDRTEYGTSSGQRESRYQVQMSDPESRFGVLPVPAPESRFGNYTVPDPVSRSGVYTVPTDRESRFGGYTVPTVPDPGSRLEAYTVPNYESRLGVYPVPDSESWLGVCTTPDPESLLGEYTVSDPESSSGVYTETDPESKLGVFTIPDPVIREPDEENSTGTGSLNCCPALEDVVQPCMAELFGTVLFVFVDCSARVGNPEPGAIQPAVAAGLIWMALIMAIGPISGGHYNPALSLTVCLCGRMQMSLLLPYFLAQFFGAMIGAALAKAIYPYGKYNASHGGAFDVASDSNPLVIAMAEGILTLVLMIVVFMVTVKEKTRLQSGPFCVGFTLTATMFAGGVASGGCMNPTRAFGPAVSSGHWTNHWVYWIGPTCGALLSVCLIRLFFDKPARFKF